MQGLVGLVWQCVWARCFVKTSIFSSDSVSWPVRLNSPLCRGTLLCSLHSSVQISFIDLYCPRTVRKQPRVMMCIHLCTLLCVWCSWDHTHQTSVSKHDMLIDVLALFSRARIYCLNIFEKLFNMHVCAHSFGLVVVVFSPATVFKWLLASL